MAWLDDVFSAIGDVGKFLGPVTQIAAPLIGASMAGNANQDAADRIIQGTQAQADQLQLGIDERLIAQLGGIDAARDFLDQRIQHVSRILQEAQTKYGGDIRRAAQDYATRVPQAATFVSDMLMGGAADYGSALRSAASGFGGDLVSAAGDYRTDLTGAAGAYRDDLMGAAGDYDARLQGSAAEYLEMIAKAPEAIRAALGPYAEAGLEMLPQMRGVALSNPNALTETQRISMEDQRKANAQKLALTGLRGSGAGVAAVMDAENRMKAGFYDQNRTRADAMMKLLGQTGYGAAGAIGSTDVNTINAGANRVYDASATGGRAMFDASATGGRAMLDAMKSAADASMKARQQAASWGLDAEKAAQDAYYRALQQAGVWQYDAANRSAGALYDAQRDVATGDRTLASNLSGQWGSYYDSQSGFARDESNAIGGAAYGKREAEARALGPIAAVGANADLASSQQWGTALGQIARTIADERAWNVRPSSYSTTDTGYNEVTQPGSQWGYL
jgi:hypothetical protein